MEAKREVVLEYEGLSRSQRDAIGWNVLCPFLAAASKSEKAVRA